MFQNIIFVKVLSSNWSKKNSTKRFKQISTMFGASQYEAVVPVHSMKAYRGEQKVISTPS
jgi:hypothetical protein